MPLGTGSRARAKTGIGTKAAAKKSLKDVLAAKAVVLPTDYYSAAVTSAEVITTGSGWVQLALGVELDAEPVVMNKIALSDNLQHGNSDAVNEGLATVAALLDANGLDIADVEEFEALETALTGLKFTAAFSQKTWGNGERSGTGMEIMADTINVPVSDIVATVLDEAGWEETFPRLAGAQAAKLKVVKK